MEGRYYPLRMVEVTRPLTSVSEPRRAAAGRPYRAHCRKSGFELPQSYKKHIGVLQPRVRFGEPGPPY